MLLLITDTDTDIEHSLILYKERVLVYHVVC